MIIRAEDVELETESDNPLTFRRMVRRDRHGPLISLTWIRLEGRHGRIVCHESDRVYYIIDGTAEFEIGDRPVEAVGAGDVVFLPRGTPYAFEGSVTYLVMNGPAFRPGSDILVD
ncbi:MAG: cupin domain-containing protein [Rhizobiales bacterium]|nr:cupin domain-containing protein [Hyphomicrobiales bacterium]